MLDELPPVAVVAHGERTLDLCSYALQALGCTRVFRIDGPGGFREKFLRFARWALELDGATMVLKVDADCLAFDGLLKLWQQVARREDLLWAEGIYYDAVMNRFRRGGPHVYGRQALAILRDEADLLPPVQKPEGYLQDCLAARFPERCISTNDVTVLHEVEQYPSKVCNTVVNRLSRENAHYYDPRRVELLAPGYRQAVRAALRHVQVHGTKSSMDHLTFDYLDEGCPALAPGALAALHRHWASQYATLMQLIAPHGDPRLIRLTPDATRVEALEPKANWAWAGSLWSVLDDPAAGDGRAAASRDRRPRC